MHYTLTLTQTGTYRVTAEYTFYGSSGSCSHFMTDELFRRMLWEAAADAQVSLRQLYVGRQGPDHPILWGVPETDYLKFYIFQVV